MTWSVQRWELSRRLWVVELLFARSGAAIVEVAVAEFESCVVDGSVNSTVQQEFKESFRDES